MKEKHLVDVYYGEHYRALDADECRLAAKRAFQHIEGFYVRDECVPWERWFREDLEGTHHAIQLLQLSPSYDIYSEHFFAGMPFWREELVLSTTSLLTLASHGYNIKDETWHGLGQRDDGVLLGKMIAALNNNVACNIQFREATSAIDFYTGTVDAYVRAYRTGENTTLAEEWCQGACKTESFMTWRMFCDRYPDMGTLIVYSIGCRLKSPESHAFAKQWLLEHPQQHEALHAFLHNRPSLWSIEHDEAMNEDTRKKSELMHSLFPDITNAGDYFQMYNHTFFSNSVVDVVTLPEGMQP